MTATTRHRRFNLVEPQDALTLIKTMDYFGLELQAFRTVLRQLRRQVPKSVWLEIYNGALKEQQSYIDLLEMTREEMMREFGQTQYGKMPAKARQEMADEIAVAPLTDEHYAEVVRNPSTARNDQERLAGLAARQVFILVDRSGSMQFRDSNPTDPNKWHWTRWDSARVATESLAEVALSMDADNKVDIMLWDGDITGQLRAVHKTVSSSSIADLSRWFDYNEPFGTTPLASALDEMYRRRFQRLLQDDEPFTCVILTDGVPNNVNAVKRFFRRLIRENNLEQEDRHMLAAFSFVRVGDEFGAIRFMQDLDNFLIRDVVDTKTDEFLFGKGVYEGQDGVGPFALLWETIYD